MRSLPYSRIFWPMVVLLVPFILIVLVVAAVAVIVEMIFRFPELPDRE